MLHAGASLSRRGLRRPREAASAAGGRRPRSDRPARASGTARTRRSRSRRRRPAGRPARARAGRSGSFGWSATSRLYASTARVASVCASCSASLTLRLALRVDRRARRGSGKIDWPAGAGQRREPLRRRAERRADLEELRVPLALGRARQMEAGELAVGAVVLRCELDGRVEGDDRLGGLALGLERRRVVAPGLRVLRLSAPSALRASDTDCARRAARAAEDVADPVPPAPTPKTTKPSPKTSARNTNIHFAWRRSRGKNIVSSIDGAVEPRGRAGATAACGFALFGRLFSNRAMRSCLAGSGPRRLRE